MGSSGKDSVHGIPQFQGGPGFHNWSFRVRAYLDAMGVEHTLTKDAPEAAAEKAKFDEADKKAKSWLIGFLGDECLETVREAKTAKQMWQALQNSHAKKSLATQNLVRKQLMRLKLQEGESMRNHLVRFDDLIRQLRVAGAELKEPDMVVTLFGTLPETYDPLITALENLGDDNLTLDVVKQRLLGEEVKQLERHQNGGTIEKSTAFAGEKERARPKKFVGKCHKCGKKGHMKKDCRQKNPSEANSATGSGSKAVSFMAGRADEPRSRDGRLSFKLDSGSSDHLVNDAAVFSSLSKLSSPIIINVAKDGETLEARKKGTIEGMSNKGVQIAINEVLYVPELRDNLMSVKKLAKAGISVLFCGNQATLRKEDTVVATAQLKGSLYELEVKLQVSYANACQAEVSDLWHRRLGHLNQQAISKLVQHNMVEGIKMKPEKIGFCEPCVQGKQCREPFDGTRQRATRVLERIHSDVCGPIDPTAWDGSRYFVSFIDDHSHFSVIYLMKKKSQVFERFREYEAMVTAAFDKKISKLTVDQGTEYGSNEQKKWYKSKGIQIESTVAYSPQQNGVAERFNRTLIEKVRAMLLDSRLPKTMWCEAALTGVYLLNRSPTAALSVQSTPAELWLGVKPNLEKLRIFGCRAFAWIPGQQRKKLDAKSFEVVMVGYASNGYRLWDRTRRKIIVARDVKFDEGRFPYEVDADAGTKSPLVVEYSYEKEGDDEAEAVTQEPGMAREIEYPAQLDQPDDSDDEVDEATASALPSQPEHHGSEGQAMVRRSDRERTLPGKLLDYFVGYGAISAVPLSTDVPKTFGEIARRDDKDDWMRAVASELESLMKNDVWQLVTCPEDVKPLKSKWVFRLKEDENGRPVRYKARLVAKGYLQQQGHDYEETYAPVARLATIRTVLAVGVHRRYYFHQMDVRTAFLHGCLKETIFMEVPDGVAVKQGQVCRLVKSLYGLKQSPRCWNERFNEAIIEMGFKRSKHDYCMYTKLDKNDELILILYVDDLLVAGRNLKSISKLKKDLASKFEMSDCGELRHFLGMKVEYNRDDGQLQLSQDASIEKLVTRFGMAECNPARTPMEKGLVLDRNGPDANQPYRELLGSLMYVMLSVRPDICYPVGYLGRFQQQPTFEHWQALKRIVRYLQGTKKFMLQFKRDPTSSPLVGYVDADWASDTEDRKSVSGYLFQVFGSTVTWCSKKQTTVATSSSEAEYIALSAAVAESLWLQGVLEDLQESTRPVTLYEDNRSCICMAKNLETKRTKHIDIKHHFVRDHVASGALKIEPIKTQNQLADIFTKALEFNRFKTLRTKLGLSD